MTKTERRKRLNELADNIEANAAYFDWGRDTAGAYDCGCIAVFAGWLWDPGYRKSKHYSTHTLRDALGLSFCDAWDLYHASWNKIKRLCPSRSERLWWPSAEVAVARLREMADE